MSDSGRRYSDTEVRKIIEKALSLQKKETKNDSVSDSQGVTLSEIDAIAREAGISSSLIRRAASELETEGVTERQNRFLGGIINPVEVRLEDGVASQNDLERVFAMIPSITGENGTGNVMGSSLSWATNSEVVQRTGHSIDISVTPSGGKSVVRVRNRLGQIAGGLFGGLMGGFGLGAGLGVGLGVGLKALGSVPFAVLFPIATVAGGYLIARLAFHLFSKSRKSRVKDMAESIVRLIESTSESRQPGGDEKLPER
jgi:hypothetical protein